MATICITGANRGIGLEMARQLKDRGDDVVAACREASEELATLDVEVIEGVDVTDDASVDKLTEALGDSHNAAVLARSLIDIDEFFIAQAATPADRPISSGLRMRVPLASSASVRFGVSRSAPRYRE